MSDLDNSRAEESHMEVENELFLYVEEMRLEKLVQESNYRQVDRLRREDGGLVGGSKKRSCGEERERESLQRNGGEGACEREMYSDLPSNVDMPKKTQMHKGVVSDEAGRRGGAGGIVGSSSGKLEKGHWGDVEGEYQFRHVDRVKAYLKGPLGSRLPNLLPTVKSEREEREEREMEPNRNSGEDSVENMRDSDSDEGNACSAVVEVDDPGQALGIPTQ